MTTVVFACVRDAGRSQTAAALFNAIVRASRDEIGRRVAAFVDAHASRQAPSP